MEELEYSYTYNFVKHVITHFACSWVHKNQLTCEISPIEKVTGTCSGPT